MAGPLRFEFAGAIYHVMARGNQGQKICLDDSDREMWLAALLHGKQSRCGIWLKLSIVDPFTRSRS
jgi:hypothetical protein